MADRKNLHIVQRDEGWGTLREGGQRATQVYNTQAEAIRAGRDMARQGQGELLIHGQDGRIRARDLVRGTRCIIANQAYSACLRGQLSSNLRRRIRPSSPIPSLRLVFVDTLSACS